MQRSLRQPRPSIDKGFNEQFPKSIVNQLKAEPQ